MKDYTEHTIDEDFSNTRLDRWFRQYFKGLSHNDLEKYLRKGFIRVNEKKIKSSYRLSEGDIIRISDFLNSFFSKNRKDIKIYGSEDFIKKNTLHIDDDLLVINKPYDLAVQGGTGIKRHLDGLLLSAFSSKKITPRLVHRLDKETSGVLIVAKNREYAQLFTSLFRIRKIHKTYIALTHGIVSKDNKTLKDDLVTIDNGKKIIQKAVSYLKLLKKSTDFSYVELNPITGRKHQLRKQLYNIGNPIIGDDKYFINRRADKMKIKSKNLLLHAYKIKFMINNTQYNFKAEYDDEFEKFLKKNF